MGLWIVAAFLWGFLEATVFFLVADILLSFAAIRLGARRAAVLALTAALAAALGGTVLFLYAQSNLDEARALVLMVPAIGPDQVAAVQGGMAESWAWSLLSGAFTGIPYKIFAVEAVPSGLHLAAFAAVSVPARLVRFLVVVGGTAVIAHVLRERLGASRRRLYLLTGSAWFLFYTGYFWLRIGAH